MVARLRIFRDSFCRCQFAGASQRDAACAMTPNALRYLSKSLAEIESKLVRRLVFRWGVADLMQANLIRGALSRISEASQDHLDTAKPASMCRACPNHRPAPSEEPRACRLSSPTRSRPTGRESPANSGHQPERVSTSPKGSGADSWLSRSLPLQNVCAT